MSTTALVVEFIIVGLMLLVASIFGIFIILDIYSISALSTMKEYISIIAIFSLVFSYVLGISIHRVSFTISYLLKRILLKIIKPQSLKACIDDASWNEKQITIRQFASENLLKYIDYELSLQRLLDTTVFIYPLLIITSSIWLSHAYDQKISLTITLNNVGIYIIILMAMFVQHRINSNLMNKSYDFIKQLEEKK
ncbi:MAG: hypothetical protein GF353_15435 [Candidatus Lokiarchaeota archaeon]|nr:hypothetical protein [Candidatus Lokiarchaeota archaeon]